MFLSFGHPNVEGAGCGLQKMAAGRAPDAFRQGRPEAWKIPGHARSKLRPQQQQLLGNLETTPNSWSMHVRGRVFEGTVAEAVAGPPLRSYPGQPQRSLCRIIRRQHRRDEAAGRVAAWAFGNAGVDMANRS